MAKLTDQQKEQLALYGLAPKNESEAAAQVREILKQHDLTDLDEESLPDLMSYLEAFPPEAKPKKAAKAAEDEDEDEEEAAPAKKAPKKPAAEAEDEEEAPAPAKKKKPAAVADEDADALATEVKDKKPAKAPEKKDKKEKAGRKAATGNTFDKASEEHLAIVNKKFLKLLPAKQFNLQPIVSGFTVRYLGENAKIVILKYSNVRVGERVPLSATLTLRRLRKLKNCVPCCLKHWKIRALKK